MQHHAADQLHVEVPHVQRAAPRFAAEGKGFRQKLVERRPVGQALLELVRCATGNSASGELLHLRLEGVDFRHTLAQALQLALVLRSDDLA